MTRVADRGPTHDGDEAPTRSTIVGVATGTPDGGIAIIRLSGPACRSIGERLARDLPPPRRLASRLLQVAGQAEHALVAWMPAPDSFTGEDVLELHIHAGERNVRGVIDGCLDVGASPAGPGDFTRRAFDHGRLTLDQAEGIAAIIGAQTDEALAQARRLLAGEVGREVEARREAAADLRAEIEANLDFPDDVDPAHVDRWREQVADLRRGVQRWLDGFEAGRRARERLRIVLAGPPNAGKSSLFNALLRRPRAIVDAKPGTTRDFVDADLQLGRVALTLVDTAGLHNASDAVEQQGIARARDQLAGADLVLYVMPADREPCSDPSALASAPAILRVETKRDLGSRRPDWTGATVTEATHDIADVETAIRVWATADREQAWIGLSRHRDCAAEALAALDRAASLLAANHPLELAAFELSVADARLSQITGRTQAGPIAEDLLSRIFSRFCIGK